MLAFTLLYYWSFSGICIFRFCSLPPKLPKSHPPPIGEHVVVVVGGAGGGQQGPQSHRSEDSYTQCDNLTSPAPLGSVHWAQPQASGSVCAIWGRGGEGVSSGASPHLRPRNPVVKWPCPLSRDRGSVILPVLCLDFL